MDQSNVMTEQGKSKITLHMKQWTLVALNHISQTLFTYYFL